jgi:hypothetical protein
MGMLRPYSDDGTTHNGPNGFRQDAAPRGDVDAGGYRASVGCSAALAAVIASVVAPRLDRMPAT